MTPTDCLQTLLKRLPLFRGYQPRKIRFTPKFLIFGVFTTKLLLCNETPKNLLKKPLISRSHPDPNKNNIKNKIQINQNSIKFHYFKNKSTRNDQMIYFLCYIVFKHHSGKWSFFGMQSFLGGFSVFLYFNSVNHTNINACCIVLLAPSISL